MEEQLISFETAKLAKEKGFREPCIYWTDEITQEMGDSNCYEEPDFDKYPLSIGICTQSLLQKWLRKKHNIQIDTTSIFNEEENQWYYFAMCHDTVIIANSTWKASYEDAIEEVLQISLKLINGEE